MSGLREGRRVERGLRRVEWWKSGLRGECLFLPRRFPNGERGKLRVRVEKLEGEVGRRYRSWLGWLYCWREREVTGRTIPTDCGKNFILTYEYLLSVSEVVIWSSFGDYDVKSLSQ